MKKPLALELTNIEASYGKSPVLKGISLKIPRGIKQIIIGPNGSGKTTLIKIINGLVKAQKGSVHILGTRLQKSNLTKLRSQIGYIPQHMGLINISTSLENVLLGALSRISTLKSIFKIFPKEEVTEAKRLLTFLGLANKIDQKVHKLSGGEKRRVAIARALMQKPKILLADEILSDLDFLNAELIMNKLKELKQEQDLTIIMIEHDLCMAKQFADKITLIQNGEVKKELLPTECENNEVCKLLH